METPDKCPECNRSDIYIYSVPPKAMLVTKYDMRLFCRECFCDTAV